VTSVPTIDCFEQERRRLFTLAYGFLGSRAEAEDIVQEAWLRWRSAPHDELRQPAAWLTTVTARLALDHLRSARVKREIEAPSAEHSVLVKSELTLAFLFLLERLGPEERAAFVLREVFDYSFREVGEMLGKSEAACRQLVKRCKEKLREDKPARHRVDRAEFDDVLGRFVTALGNGDEAQLLQLLAPDAVLYGDGGGKALSVINPLQGPDRIVRFLLGLYRKYPGQFSYRHIDVNGTPALIVSRVGGDPLVAGYSVSDGRITRIFHVLNPDKLTTLPRL